MTERRAPEPGLERALAELAGRIDFPRTPELAGSVRRRIAERPQPRAGVQGWLRPWPRLAGAVALALLLAVAALLGLSSGVRDAVADLLGLRGVSVTTLPEVPPSGVPSLSGAAGALTLDGRPATLAEARREVAFPVRVPTLPELGEPDAVYVGMVPPGGIVSLVYTTRPGLPPSAESGVGLLLTQFRGDFGPYLQKGLPPGARLEPVTVGGAASYWIAGSPHVVFYRDARGEVRQDQSRLAGNTLLWERDGITYRLESALSRDQALRVAESVR